MNKNSFKLTDRLLLELLLKQNKMTYVQFVKDTERKYNIKNAKQIGTLKTDSKNINPRTGETFYANELVFDTGTHLLKTTEYGRIKDIEEKPRSVTTPKVIIKKARKF